MGRALTPEQKAAHAARMREWRRLHPVESRDRAAQYRREHVEELTVTRHLRYWSNRAKHLARMALYKARNRDRFAALRRAAYAANRPVVLARKRAAYAADRSTLEGSLPEKAPPPWGHAPP